MRQILYVSLSTTPGDKADLVGILDRSRHNNAIDGITGLLWSDGHSFLQVLEGPKASVAATFARICADPRHHSITTLVDVAIESTTFGGWAMAHRRADDASNAHDARMRRLLLNAPDAVRAHFLSLIATGEVALPIPTAIAQLAPIAAHGER